MRAQPRLSAVSPSCPRNCPNVCLSEYRSFSTYKPGASKHVRIAGSPRGKDSIVTSIMPPLGVIIFITSNTNVITIIFITSNTNVITGVIVVVIIIIVIIIIINFLLLFLLLALPLLSLHLSSLSSSVFF